MADDNVLRIEFEDITASQGGGAGGGGSPSPQGGGTNTPAHKRGNQPFDPIEAAQKRIMGEERKKEVDYYYNLAKYGNPDGPGQSGSSNRQMFRAASGTLGQMGVPGAGLLGSMAGVAGAFAPLLAVGAAAGTLVAAFHKLDGAMQNQMDRMARFSPQLTLAKAERSLSRMMGDMQRAQDVDLQNVLAGRERGKAFREEASQNLQANITKKFGDVVSNHDRGMGVLIDNISGTFFGDQAAKDRVALVMTRVVGNTEKHNELLLKVIEAERAKQVKIDNMLSDFSNMDIMKEGGIFGSMQSRMDEMQRLTPVLEQL